MKAGNATNDLGILKVLIVVTLVWAWRTSTKSQWYWSSVNTEEKSSSVWWEKTSYTTSWHTVDNWKYDKQSFKLNYEQLPVVHQMGD